MPLDKLGASFTQQLLRYQGYHGKALLWAHLCWRVLALIRLQAQSCGNQYRKAMYCTITFHYGTGRTMFLVLLGHTPCNIFIYWTSVYSHLHTLCKLLSSNCMLPWIFTETFVFYFAMKWKVLFQWHVYIVASIYFTIFYNLKCQWHGSLVLSENIKQTLTYYESLQTSLVSEEFHNFLDKSCTKLVDNKYWI